MMSKKILFFGNERLATGTTTTCVIASSLLNAGFEIAAIVVNRSDMSSRKAKLREIEDFAKNHHIPVHAPKSLSSITDKLKGYSATLAVLVAYGKIVPESTIALFPKGIINVHPSLLPLHRGPTPIESAILSGDKSTGVSIMQLVKAMDAGPVYAQKSMMINENMSKQDLCNQLSRAGAELLTSCLPQIIDGTLKPLAQKEQMATYDQKIIKSHSAINWRQASSRIMREIRAYSGWPGSKTTVKNIEVTITKGHISSDKGIVGDFFKTKDKLLGCYTTDGAIIIEALKPVGKKEMPSSDFINGYLKDLK